jgi:hypothetical protein
MAFGDIVTNLTVDKRQFEKGFADAENRVERFSTRTRTATGSLNTMTASSGRTSFMISQLGFAVEDATTQFGTMGLAGALRAAGNNLSIVASMLNPVAGIVVGVGTALASVLIPHLTKTGDEAEKSKKKLDEWAATFRNIQRDVSGQDFFGVGRQFRRGDLGAQDSDALAKESREAARERLRIDAQIEAVQQQRQAVLQRAGVPDFLSERLGMPTATNPNPAASALSSLARSNPGFKGVSEEDKKALDELNEKLKDLGDEAFEVGTRIKDSLDAMAGARAREQQETRKALEEQGKARDVEVAKLERQRKERVESLREDMLGIVDPGQSSINKITGSLEERRKEIIATTFGKERAGLLSLANQAAIEQAKSLKTRLPQSAEALASVTTRGNAADFLNTLRSQGDVKSEETKLAEQQLKEQIEQNKKLQKVIDALKEHPDSVPTSMGF